MVSVERRAPVGGHPVVALAGDLDVVGVAAAATAVAASITAGRRLIIDLDALESIDCSGVRALLSVQALARRAGGDVFLAAPQALVLRLVTLLRLADVLNTRASVAAAAASARPALRGQLACDQYRAPGEGSDVRRRIRTDHGPPAGTGPPPQLTAS
jgi:anti-sigma B factor antagonist